VGWAVTLTYADIWQQAIGHAHKTGLTSQGRAQDVQPLSAQEQT
jgi:hypothetical protein